MKKLLILALLCLPAHAATYYVCAATGAPCNASDANAGTSKTATWLHAPGMPSATGLAASTTINAGDSIIFRGGDTWHFNSGTPSIGGAWNWTVSGTTTNCQLNPSAGTVLTTTCIYIGVDLTWFSGVSFTRPILSQDNPIVTSRPASCSFDATSFNAVNLGSFNYVIFDNFEMLGACWTGSSSDQWVTTSGTQVEVSNNYFHGSTMCLNAVSCAGVDDTYHFIGGNMPKANFIRCDHNVFDNSDGSLGTTAGQATGFSINNTCKEISFNVFSHVSNGCICNPASVHDNLFQFMYEPVTAQHGNIIETNTAQSITGPVYFYNNVMHNTNEGVGIWLETVSENLYEFNNVSWHYREFANGANGADGTNCYMYDQGSSSVHVYFFGNSTDFPCTFRTLNGAAPTITFQNDHYIGYSPAVLSSTYSFPTGTVVDNDNHVFQTEAVANGQGYVTGNNYAPTLISNATVGAGGNLSSFCSGLSDSIAGAACKDGITGVTYNTSNHNSVPNSITARPAGGAWDTGAYEFATNNITLTIIVTGNGSVSDSQGGIVNCTSAGGSNCNATYASGTSDTLTETPTAPYFDGGFSSPCVPQTNNATPCVLTLSSNTSVTATFLNVQLPRVWVNNLEYLGTTANTITFPNSWSCSGTGYPTGGGNYTNNPVGLQQAVNDAETCRTNTNAGTTIIIPAGTTYSSANGLMLPQTVGDNSSNFIVLTSSNPAPLGVTIGSHGIQDNVLSSTRPGLRNPGLTGTNMSYQLGTTISSIPVGPFTLNNNTATNTSQYNDIGRLWGVSNTAVNQDAISTGLADGSNIGPHHYAILNANVFPAVGLSATAAPIAIGQGSETLVSQIPTHIHIAYSYIHGDWTDAPMTGCPSACVATGPPTGANILANMVTFNGCIACSLSYSYIDSALRPGAEGHGLSLLLTHQLKIVHNWIEGQSIGILVGGQSGQIPITGFIGGMDVEDRSNRYTYPYSWMLANAVGVLSQISKDGTGTGSNYAVNDTFNVIQGGASGGTGIVTTIGAGGTLTGANVTAIGSGYVQANSLAITCISCASGGTGGTVNISTGYQPNGVLNGGHGYVRKNSHELKVGERYLMDGNIFENVDNSGAQNGTIISIKVDNNSSLSSGATNNWLIDEHTTITNNIMRDSCNGPSLGYRSNSSGGDGGGTTLPSQLELYANNLLYGYGTIVPGCQFATPQFGFRIASSGTAAVWPIGHVSAHRDSTGQFVTLTLTSSVNPDLSVSGVSIGDPVNVSGCTTDATMNTGQTTLGPPALTGTLVNGLTVVYASVGPASTTDNTCVFNNGQGWPNYVIANHNSDFANNPSFSNDPYNGTNGGTNPRTFARNVSIQNSIFVGGGVNSSQAEGTRTTISGYDPTTLTFNNDFIGGRGGISCPGFSGAGCYTEYGGATPGSPPTTIYVTPTSNCTGSDPIVGTCLGVLALMSQSSVPLFPPAVGAYIAGDYHAFRLCQATDVACNSKQSLYGAGNTNQATDGTDLGPNLSAIDAAQNAIIYVCQTPCGTGPYFDVPTIATSRFGILLQ